MRSVLVRSATERERRVMRRRHMVSVVLIHAKKPLSAFEIAKRSGLTVPEVRKILDRDPHHWAQWGRKVERTQVHGKTYYQHKPYRGDDRDFSHSMGISTYAPVRAVRVEGPQILVCSLTKEEAQNVEALKRQGLTIREVKTRYWKLDKAAKNLLDWQKQYNERTAAAIKRDFPNELPHGIRYLYLKDSNGNRRDLI
jgi:hypothetical protein